MAQRPGRMPLWRFIDRTAQHRFDPRGRLPTRGRGSQGQDQGQASQAMIRFTRLLIRDFGPFAEADLKLSSLGLAMIRGENRDSDAADSNGSGKSTLTKALGWALFGETLGGEKGDAIVRRGAAAAEVSVSWHDGSTGYTVIRKRPADLKLFRDTAEVSGPVIKDTQAEINRLLGMDFATWRNTVLFGQGDVARF